MSSRYKNFFGYVDRAKIKKVKLNTEKFTYIKLDQIEQEVYQTRLLYWDLVFAQRDLNARSQALRKAQDFYQNTLEKLDLGLSEKPDLFAAEAHVRKRVIEVREALRRFCPSYN